jgi:hypothetical protein
MIKNFSSIILVVVITGLIYGGIMYLVIEDSKVCDEQVTLDDGTLIKSTNVVSRDSGMSTIETCDGERIQVPTIKIKMITRDESKTD